MVDHVTIVEVSRRSEQGVTKPFYCRGEDGKWYWVKGNGAGKRALCCEWVAGRLAQTVGLPVPPFAQVEVPDALVRQSVRTDIHDLGAGLAFGSEHVPNTRECDLRDLPKVDLTMRLSILLFDWWVQNTDRTLGEKGGNPNLLWTPAESDLTVIDHNLAFDPGFDVDAFRRGHVFAADVPAVLSESGLAVRAKMQHTFAEVEKYVSELPEEWLFLDSGQAAPTDFGLEDVRRVLLRLVTDFQTDWGMSK